MKISVKNGLIILIAVSATFGAWLVFQNQQPIVSQQLSEKPLTIEPYTPPGWRRESRELYPNANPVEAEKLQLTKVEFSVAFPEDSLLTLKSPSSIDLVLRDRFAYCRDCPAEREFEAFHSDHPFDPLCTKTIATSTFPVADRSVFKGIVYYSRGGFVIANDDPDSDFPIKFIPSEKPCEPALLAIHYRILISEKRDLRGTEGYNLHIYYETKPETVNEDEAILDSIIQTLSIK